MNNFVDSCESKVVAYAILSVRLVLRSKVDYTFDVFWDESKFFFRRTQSYNNNKCNNGKLGRERT